MKAKECAVSSSSNSERPGAGPQPAGGFCPWDLQQCSDRSVSPGWAYCGYVNAWTEKCRGRRWPPLGSEPKTDDEAVVEEEDAN